MAFHLTVVVPFGDYQRGSVITNEAEVVKVLASENAAHVVRVAAPPAEPVTHEIEREI